MAKQKPGAKIQIEELLFSHSPEIRELVQSLRYSILEIVPDAVEAAHPVWHSINYRHPESGYFCGIFPQQDRVKIGFEFGVLLPDPENLLEGDGKQVRYLTLRDEDSIPSKALKDFILAAIALPASRQVRLALVRSGAKPIS